MPRREIGGGIVSGVELKIMSVLATHALITKVIACTSCRKITPATCSGKPRRISRLESFGMLLALSNRWDSAGSDPIENVKRPSNCNNSLRSLRHTGDVQKIDKGLVRHGVFLACQGVRQAARAGILGFQRIATVRNRTLPLRKRSTGERLRLLVVL